MTEHPGKGEAWGRWAHGHGPAPPGSHHCQGRPLLFSPFHPPRGWLHLLGAGAGLCRLAEWMACPPHLRSVTPCHSLKVATFKGIFTPWKSANAASQHLLSLRGRGGIPAHDWPPVRSGALRGGNGATGFFVFKPKRARGSDRGREDLSPLTREPGRFFSLTEHHQHQAGCHEPTDGVSPDPSLEPECGVCCPEEHGQIFEQNGSFREGGKMEHRGRVAG